MTNIYDKTEFKPRNLKEDLGLFLTPVLTLWGSAILTVTYGGELLYLPIWRKFFDAICAPYRCHMIHRVITYMYA